MVKDQKCDMQGWCRSKYSSQIPTFIVSYCIYLILNSEYIFTPLLLTIPFNGLMMFDDWCFSILQAKKTSAGHSGSLSRLCDLCESRVFPGELHLSGYSSIILNILWYMNIYSLIQYILIWSQVESGWVWPSRVVFVRLRPGRPVQDEMLKGSSDILRPSQAISDHLRSSQTVFGLLELFAASPPRSPLVGSLCWWGGVGWAFTYACTCTWCCARHCSLALLALARVLDAMGWDSILSFWFLRSAGMIPFWLLRSWHLKFFLSFSCHSANP